MQELLKLVIWDAGDTGDISNTSNTDLVLITYYLNSKYIKIFQKINLEQTSSPGHFLAKCFYCPAKWSRGELQKLEAHLALECPNIDNEIQQLYLLQVAYCNNLKEQSKNITGSKKQKLNNQPNLTKYFLQKTEDLSKERINFINSLLLKAFVVCSIPFSVIETPFFINSLQNLCPTYPTYQLLSREDFSANSHTAKFLADEIDIILNEIGCDKFAAI
ncbi:32215_t:CDS:2, partial [Gigaspora margarita]